MEKIKIAVSGAAGRMGRRIIALIAEDEECELVCALEADGCAALSRDAGEAAGVAALEVIIGARLSGSPDVLIDFSRPDACLKRLEECAERRIAAVVGTTGFDEAGRKRLGELSGRMALLVAPNMSLGVNLMFQLAPQIASRLGAGYDIEIVESHHKHKKDAPSGTALRIAEAICDALRLKPEDALMHGREGITGERPQGQIGVHAVRGGDVVGEHTVIYAGDGERLELIHRASSRDVFAAGAVKAAKFIKGKNPGLYDMQDMLDMR